MGTAADDRDFVEVWQGYDPVFADMARDALAADGIPARIRGSQNAALLGVGQYALTVAVDVPEADAPRAVELLRALFEAEPPAEEDEPAAPEEPAPEPEDGVDAMPRPDDAAADAYRPPRRLDAGPPARAGRRKGKPESEPERRSRVLALGLALVLPGLSQVYVRRGAAGLCLIFGLFFAVVIAAGTGLMAHLGAAIVLAMIADAIAGQRGVSALARGERMPTGTQWLVGWGQVVGIQIGAWAIAQLAALG